MGRRKFTPRPDCDRWPSPRKLELDWIIGELNAFQAVRHPHMVSIICEQFPSLRDDIPRLGAQAHDWLCRRMLATAPTSNLEAAAELYRLLAETAGDFNRTVFDSGAAYATDPESPWPFKYWSYMRWNTIKIAEGKAGAPDRYETAYLPIGGANGFYLDRIRRAHQRISPALS